MKKLLIISLILTGFSAAAQKFEGGFLYSPAMLSKLTYDKQYIIFEDYTSLTAGGNEFHPYISPLSTGVFFRYRMPHVFYRAEIDFFENKFRRSIPDWKTTRDKYFNYSAIEIPIMAGYTINPGSMFKFHIFGGLNNKVGRFRTVFFSTLTYTINDSKSYEYYSDLPKKLELIDRFSLYYLNALGGIGFSFYGMTVDLRAEKNITGLNHELLTNSANYKDLITVRLCISGVINIKKKK